ncbi:MAG: Membrane-associated zinc metalloprotease [Microgenomates group bacterium GW2011_GWF2_45_18]|nr:MAG: Membrane-associated zinc metalloprotease [Microgenomates group bacterium GW2011_GWF1_44_10]KKU01429.1 MAG: Membrane-associated zinc metalloprotease [Microgenomates group bacterium GW2011_GWF2_45_18]OGJ41506.1 MAG: hypothetical protein A2378_00480 [Candidatus Pacebacteria bacterium RIFOXYB1_FULL_44_10]HAU98855.1 hypothetical protein [Candidatus Paceibacterota bacterium]HAX01187.1 hypothetical protein [Candidatus Paceibacterota bacterium]
MIVDLIGVIFALELLVVLHELGHFLVAKWVGIGVDEFGVGYPPKAFTLFRWGDTEFTFNWLPLGGFVRMFGDDADTLESLGKNASAIQNNTGDPRLSFEDASVPKRLAVIVAGPLVNILVGVIAFTAIYSAIGIPQHPIVREVVVGSPAEQAGLRVQDRLLFAEGEPIQIREDFLSVLSKNVGKTVNVSIDRGGTLEELKVYVRKSDEIPEGQGAVGIRFDDDMKFFAWYEMPFRAMAQGVKDSWKFSVLVAESFVGLLSKLGSGNIPEELSGPIGIVSTATTERLMTKGWILAVSFIGIISMNLAILNIFPIPVLDGGRAIFVLLERVLGKKRRKVWEGYANMGGLGFLLVLMLLATGNDLMRMFGR